MVCMYTTICISHLTYKPARPSFLRSLSQCHCLSQSPQSQTQSRKPSRGWAHELAYTSASGVRTPPPRTQHAPAPTPTSTHMHPTLGLHITNPNARLTRHTLRRSRRPHIHPRSSARRSPIGRPSGRLAPLARAPSAGCTRRRARAPEVAQLHVSCMRPTQSQTEAAQLHAARTESERARRSLLT